MALYVLCLVIMCSLTIFSIITGQDLITTTISNSYTIPQIVNGTTTELDLIVSVDMSLNTLYEALGWITAVAVIAIGINFAVLGSGIGDVGSRWMTLGTFFISIWIVLSGLSAPLIVSIQVIGLVLYLVLTVIYAISAILFIGNKGG